MKIRQGFVSNSSSSSFIVCFPRVPKDLMDVQEMMFGRDGGAVTAGFDDGSYSATDVAGTVWRDIEQSEPLTKEQIAEAMGSYFDGNLDMEQAPEYPHIPGSLYRKYDGDYRAMEKDPEYLRYKDLQEQWRKDFEAWQKRAAEKFVNEHKGVYYQFEYSDNDGAYYATLEHGNTFENLPYIRVSHH